MKKYLFNLLFGAAVLTTHPLFAMVDSEEKKTVVHHSCSYCVPFELTELSKEKGLGTLYTLGEDPLMLIIGRDLPTTNAVSFVSKTLYNLSRTLLISPNFSQKFPLHLKIVPCLQEQWKIERAAQILEFDLTNSYESVGAALKSLKGKSDRKTYSLFRESEKLADYFETLQENEITNTPEFPQFLNIGHSLTKFSNFRLILENFLRKKHLSQPTPQEEIERKQALERAAAWLARPQVTIIRQVPRNENPNKLKIERGYAGQDLMDALRKAQTEAEIALEENKL